MSISQLMMPRYKVIEKWPNMVDFSIGQIVVLDKDFSPEYQKYEVEDCQGKRSYINSFFDEYPLLFKKLQWWEEREDAEPCDFVKNKQGEVFLLHKVSKDRALISNSKVDNHFEFLETLLPSSRIEYDDYNFYSNQTQSV